MTFYITLMLALTLIGYIICYKTKLKYADAIFMGIVFVVLTFLSAVRYEVGMDYSFEYVPQWRKLLSLPISSLGEMRHEKGFVLFELLISKFSQNFQWLFVSISILLGILSIYYLYKYSSCKPLSFFIFFSLGLYYCSMNFLRQTIAACIVAYAIIFIKKQKIIPYMLLVLLASTFHKSALIMIPFYFILQIKITKVVLVFYSLITIGIFVYSNKILDFVTTYFYKNYHQSQLYLLKGIDWYDAIVPVVLFLLMFIFQDVLCEKDKSNKIFVSCSFFSMFFYIIAVHHSIIDRLTMYFDLPLVIGLTYLISGLYNKYKLSNENVKLNQIKYILVSVIVIASVSFANYRQLIYDGHFVVPYQSIFQSEEYKIYYESLKDEVILEDNQPEEIDLTDILS